jgi:hypothetical protein
MLAGDRSAAERRRWMRNRAVYSVPEIPFQKPLIRRGFWRLDLELLIVAVAAVVATLGIILFAVHKFRPRSLRFTASVTRWLQLTLEIEQPQRSNRQQPP